MALNLEQKKAIVSEIAQVAMQSVSAIAAYYAGLTVGELNQLRAEARSTGVYLRVVRNTLAKRALEGTAFHCLQESLAGPLILAFSQEEPGAAARVLRTFMKKHKLLEVKAIVLEGQLLSAHELAMVAQLPSRLEAIALLMSVIQAPVVKLVRTLVEPYTGLVRVMAAIRDQKQAVS